MTTAPLMHSFQFDAAYISGLREHDPTIQSHFVEYFSPILQRKLHRHSSHRINSSDIQQETFARVLAVIQAGGQIHRPESFGAFVLGVCSNVLLERWRSDQRYQPLAMAEPERLDDALLPHEMLIRAETAHDTQRVLSRLSGKNRKILEGIFMEETKRDEICEQLGVSRAQLRMLLLRAKRQFLKEHNRIRSRERKPGSRFLSPSAKAALPLPGFIPDSPQGPFEAGKLRLHAVTSPRRTRRGRKVTKSRSLAA